MPAAASISASASMKGMPSRAASRPPIDDFPAPIIPMSTIERFPSAATSVASDGEAIIPFCMAERRIGRLRGAPPRPKTPIHPTSSPLPVVPEHGGYADIRGATVWRSPGQQRVRAESIRITRCPDGRGRPAIAPRRERAGVHDMPSLLRLLVVLGLLGGLAYAAMFALANFVQPKPREITVTIPQDRLAKPHLCRLAAGTGRGGGGDVAWGD